MRASTQSLELASQSSSNSFSSASTPVLSKFASLGSEFFHFADLHSGPSLLAAPLNHPVPPHSIRFDCCQMTPGIVVVQVEASECSFRFLWQMKARSWSWSSFQRWTEWKDFRPVMLVTLEWALCLGWSPHSATSFSVGEPVRNFDFQFNCLYFPFQPNSFPALECDPMYYQVSWSCQVMEGNCQDGFHSSHWNVGLRERRAHTVGLAASFEVPLWVCELVLRMK